MGRRSFIKIRNTRIKFVLFALSYCVCGLMSMTLIMLSPYFELCLASPNDVCADMMFKMMILGFFGWPLLLFLACVYSIGALSVSIPLGLLWFVTEPWKVPIIYYIREYWIKLII